MERSQILDGEVQVQQRINGSNIVSKYLILIRSIKLKKAGIRIGEWNAGTYYLDDIYFDNYLYSGLPSLVPTKPEANIS